MLNSQIPEMEKPPLLFNFKIIVLLPTIFLRSGVVLNVEPGATILGGPRQKDYPKESSRWYVVLAENATDVGIAGGGVVDAQAEKFVVRYNERKEECNGWLQEC